jgi:hypothetical protein
MGFHTLAVPKLCEGGSTLERTGKECGIVDLGRLAGLKGGKARARKLRAEQRQRSALKAARARWSKGER